MHKSPHVRWRRDRGYWEVVTPGGKREKLGPTDADRERGEKIAAIVGEKLADEEPQMSARDARRALERRLKTPRGPRSPLPADECLDEWFRLNSSTMSDGYEELAEGLIRLHLVPFFGKRDLRTMDESDAIAFATYITTRGKRREVVGKNGKVEVVESGLSVSRARAGLTIMRTLCRTHRRALGGFNPFLGFDSALNRMEAKHATRVIERDAWTQEELHGILLLARLHEPWLYPMIVHASHTGARIGETVAQLWTGIDFARSEVRITGQMRKRREGLTKERGRRAKIIPMWAAGPLLREVLEERAAKRGITEPWKTPTLVFFEPDGRTPIDQRGSLRTAWDRLRARMVERKIRPLVWHCFRHTFITHAIEARVSAKRVGEMVGHSSTFITDQYAHAMPQPPEGVGWLEAPPTTGLRPLSGVKP